MMLSPKYVLAGCIAVAIVVMPALVFLRFAKFDSITNAVVVGVLVAVYVGYKAWFDKQQKT